MPTFACPKPKRPPLPAALVRPLATVALILLGACASSGGSASADAGWSDGASGGSATGGRQGASGGDSGTGGRAATGGATGSGGANGTGGRSGTGGTAAGTGGGGGVSGAGGAGGVPVATGGTSGAGEFGFTYRKPGPTDVDWLCTFRQAGAAGHVYVRLNQTGTMSVGIATVPVYTAVLAQLSTSGAPSALANVQYDYGGGHHNDSLRFDYQGQTYKYYHSSFGFGFRSCQPMDCIDVYATGATAPLTEGCTPARALPEICVPIKSDGTHDPLIDRFMKCPGDTARPAATAPISP